jgi:hypothetical protein
MLQGAPLANLIPSQISGDLGSSSVFNPYYNHENPSILGKEFLGICRQVCASAFLQKVFNHEEHEVHEERN